LGRGVGVFLLCGRFFLAGFDGGGGEHGELGDAHEDEEGGEAEGEGEPGNNCGETVIRRVVGAVVRVVAILVEFGVAVDDFCAVPEFPGFVGGELDGRSSLDDKS